MNDTPAWLEELDALDELHHKVISDDERAEWARLTAEHDAVPALSAALRAALSEETARRLVAVNHSMAVEDLDMSAGDRALVEATRELMGTILTQAVASAPVHAAVASSALTALRQNVERLEAVEFIHNGCEGIRRRDVEAVLDQRDRALDQVAGAGAQALRDFEAHIPANLSPEDRLAVQNALRAQADTIAARAAQ